MTKHKQYFDMMCKQNTEKFARFKEIHDNYASHPAMFKAQFDEEGKKIVDVIRDWETRLCMQSEKSSYGVYSSGLADKFWDEVRKLFPQIDFVGVK